MSNFNVSKVLNTLPAELTSSTLYFVRSGTGFDLYLTDKQTPAVAVRLNDTVIDTLQEVENWWASSAAKLKLDGIAVGANNYVHPTHSARPEGLYAVVVDALGHIQNARPATSDDLPDINAAKLTSGVLAADRIPALAADKIAAGTLSADRIPALPATKVTSGTFDPARIPGISAEKITSGTINIDRLPAGALERLVRVSDQVERFALTPSVVQVGDTVLQEDTQVMYRVVDEAKLSTNAGYVAYTAARASAVAWSGVENKPSTVAGYGITDAVLNGDARLTDARDWVAPVATPEELTAGTETAPRKVSPADLRIAVYAFSQTADNHGPYGLSFNQETNVYEILGASKRTQIQEQMRRCVLTKQGQVAYYLNEFDSTKKADGSPADLSGKDGQVMVQIPKYYVKRSLQGNLHTWEVSLDPAPGFVPHRAYFRNDTTEVPYAYYRAYEGINQNGVLMSISGVTPTRSTDISNFRAYARANGTGWSIAHWQILDAIRLLFLTEYNTLNSQAVLGSGNDSGSDYGILTGQSNVIGNHSSGPLNNNTWMSYRGIENFYADIWEFVDGVGVKDYKIYLCNDEREFADGVYTGAYVDTGIVVPASSGSYVKQFTNDFFPQVIGGTSETYLTDGLWSAGGERVTLFGGAAGGGRIGGAFALSVDNTLSAAGASIGAGLSYR